LPGRDRSPGTLVYLKRDPRQLHAKDRRPRLKERCFWRQAFKTLKQGRLNRWLQVPPAGGLRVARPDGTHRG